MKIDFSYTSQDSHNQIEYYNVRGQVVKTYQLSQLIEYVINNNLNLSHAKYTVGGTGMVSDPNTDFLEQEVLYDVHDFIDENWRSVTEDFYNAMNPTEYQAKNKPQQTKETV